MVEVTETVVMETPLRSAISVILTLLIKEPHLFGKYSLVLYAKKYISLYEFDYMHKIMKMEEQMKNNFMKKFS